MIGCLLALYGMTTGLVTGAIAPTCIDELIQFADNTIDNEI